MNKRILRYLDAYRKVLIGEYAALLDREKFDEDKDAGEDAKRLIKEIQDLKFLTQRHPK